MSISQDVGIHTVWEMLIDLLVLSTVLVCHPGVVRLLRTSAPPLYPVARIMGSQDVVRTEAGRQVQGSENSSEPRERKVGRCRGSRDIREGVVRVRLERGAWEGCGKSGG